MNQEKRDKLHPRNRHNGGYNFDALVGAHAALKPYVTTNKYGGISINFFDPKAVKALNAALLKLHYGVEWWDIPSSALTPPIPGRADYIHYVADLLGGNVKHRVRCLDVGVGANCIYPIIGRAEYGWDFVGCDIEQSSLDSAQRIVRSNKILDGFVDLRLQSDSKSIFDGVINSGEYFDVTICNPPFHDSAQSAQRGTQRKLRALGGQKKMVLNFSGQSNELWCEGGERLFIHRMILQSRTYAKQCGWFTTLVSNEDNIPSLRKSLREVGAKEHRIIEMHQGNKRSRILAWRY